jgi:hypothetical protein
MLPPLNALCVSQTSRARGKIVVVSEEQTSGQPAGATLPIPGFEDLQLVLDTNVMLEIVSAELWTHGDTHANAEAVRKSPDFRSRQLRARYSLCLAWVCASESLATFALKDEVLALLERNAPPGSEQPAAALTMIIAHLVLEGVLGGWRGVLWSDDKFQPSGNDADDFLVRVAQSHRVPLITNEGLTLTGIDNHPRKLRGKSIAAHVAAYSPKEYLDHKAVDVDVVARSFYDAFVLLGERALRGETALEVGRAGVVEALKALRGFYALVLLDAVDESVDGIVPPSIAWDAG